MGYHSWNHGSHQRLIGSSFTSQSVSDSVSTAALLDIRLIHNFCRFSLVSSDLGVPHLIPGKQPVHFGTRVFGVRFCRNFFSLCSRGFLLRNHGTLWTPWLVSASVGRTPCHGLVCVFCLFSGFLCVLFLTVFAFFTVSGTVTTCGGRRHSSAEL